MRVRCKLLLLVGASLFMNNQAGAEPAKVTVYAAVSLTNVLNDIDADFERSTGGKVVPSFASSSTLAKQIENGAPADVFISADEKWMDYLAKKGKIDPSTRHDLLGNDLVLVAPKGKRATVAMDKSFNFSASFDGKICTGDPERVPVGMYAKQALQQLGWWDGVAPRLVPADDVRAALVFVEREECDLGIVYATDAMISEKVETVATFPSSSHDPIVYPVAVVSGDHPSAGTYLEHLSSKVAMALFKKYGFKVTANKH